MSASLTSECITKLGNTIVMSLRNNQPAVSQMATRSRYKPTIAPMKGEMDVHWLLN
jgi:hypothetical protein